MPCQLPFSYGGTSHSQCAQTKTPEARSKICGPFARWAERTRVKLPAAVVFWDEKGNASRQAVCHGTSPGGLGWCVTCPRRDEQTVKPNPACDKTPKPVLRLGQRTAQEKEDDEEQRYASAHWGRCAHWCAASKINRTKVERLQEAKLSILSQSQCEHFGKSLYVNSSLELCAAKRTRFPRVRRFKLVTLLNGSEHYEATKTDVVHVVGPKIKDYDFFLGGSDSCQVNAIEPCLTR
jgi:hypothetical protein